MKLFSCNTYRIQEKNLQNAPGICSGDASVILTLSRSTSSTFVTSKLPAANRKNHSNTSSYQHSDIVGVDKFVYQPPQGTNAALGNICVYRSRADLGTHATSDNTEGIVPSKLLQWCVAFCEMWGYTNKQNLNGNGFGKTIHSFAKQFSQQRNFWDPNWCILPAKRISLYIEASSFESYNSSSLIKHELGGGSLRSIPSKSLSKYHISRAEAIKAFGSAIDLPAEGEQFSDAESAFKRVQQYAFANGFAAVQTQKNEKMQIRVLSCVHYGKSANKRKLTGDAVRKEVYNELDGVDDKENKLRQRQGLIIANCIYGSGIAFETQNTAIDLCELDTQGGIWVDNYASGRAVGIVMGEGTQMQGQAEGEDE
ncbi:hypothetical protein BDD12DRAFT_982030 [Trichophaea hybrida]|nr:hypothetical protein BDD12DRAFT_982030 [Trichophaea hybrida]